MMAAEGDLDLPSGARAGRWHIRTMTAEEGLSGARARQHQPRRIGLLGACGWRAAQLLLRLLLTGWQSL